MNLQKIKKIDDLHRTSGPPCSRTSAFLLDTSPKIADLNALRLENTLTPTGLILLGVIHKWLARTLSTTNQRNSEEYPSMLTSSTPIPLQGILLNLSRSVLTTRTLLTTCYIIHDNQPRCRWHSWRLLLGSGVSECWRWYLTTVDSSRHWVTECQMPGIRIPWKQNSNRL